MRHLPQAKWLRLRLTRSELPVQSECFVRGSHPCDKFFIIRNREEGINHFARHRQHYAFCFMRHLPQAKWLRLRLTRSELPVQSECFVRGSHPCDKFFIIRNREEGIRTPGGIAPTQPFQDCTLSHSDTSLYIIIEF